MSIEFKNSRWGRNRNSRLFKKTRRAAMKKLDAPHLPMRVQTGKNGYWGQTSNYSVHTPYDKIHKFLKARVGQPINKVFKEFLAEARKFRQSYNLEEAFYYCIDYKERKLIYGKAKGFYISNGILNYRNDWVREKEEPTPEKLIKYNEEHWDESVFDIFKPLHNTGPSPIGKFWVEINNNYIFLPVYAVYKGKWDYAEDNDKVYSHVWKARKKIRYDYLKEFSKCIILGKGGWFRILQSFVTPADWHNYDDYNYFYYIVRNSDIEKYKRKHLKK